MEFQGFFKWISKRNQKNSLYIADFKLIKHHRIRE